MKSLNKIFLAGAGVLTMTLYSFSVAAQKKDWEEIESVEIRIVKERQITLPKADRNFEKIPPRASEPIKPPITYEFRSFSFQAPQLTPAIRPLKLKADTKTPVYGSYIRAGYGNYGTPLLEAYLNNRRDKNKLLGAHLFHTSSAKGPVDGKNSGNGLTGISLYGRSLSEDVAVSGSLDFENQFTHFYGYPKGLEVDEDTLRQSFKLFKLSGDVSNAKNSEFAYKLGAGFSHLSDKFDAQEWEVDINFKSAYELDEKSRIDFRADFALITRKDSEVEAKPRSLFTLAPAYSFEAIENLKVSVGAIMAFENDTIDSKDVHFYPDLKAQYPISPSVDLVGTITGGIEKVSLQSLVHENLWLAPNVGVFHTNTFDFGLGINARVGNKVAVHSGLALSNLKNWYNFVTSPEDQSKFVTVYDEGSVRRTNVYAALNYAPSELAKFMIRGDVYKYIAGDLPEVWHRPTYKVTVHGSYNIVEKIILTADLIAQGGMKAYDPATDATIKLDGAFDLNAKAEYIFSPSFSAFAQFNNITSNQYPIYLNYPVRGFQFLAGITWSF